MRFVSKCTNSFVRRTRACSILFRYLSIASQSQLHGIASFETKQIITSKSTTRFLQHFQIIRFIYLIQVTIDHNNEYCIPRIRTDLVKFQLQTNFNSQPTACNICSQGSFFFQLHAPNTIVREQMLSIRTT